MIRSFRRVVDLFDRRDRWQFLALCGVMGVVALVQVIGVASVLPFMSIAANPGLISENAWMSRLYELGGFESTRAFLLVAGLALLGLMALSNSLSAFETWLMFHVVWRKQHRLSVRLLGQYLDEPYQFFLASNSAALGKNILVDVLDVITGVVVPGLRVVSQGLVIVFVVALLFLVDAKVATAALVVLGGGYGLIYTFVRRKLAQLGSARLNAHEYRFRAVTEALGSIKESRVLGREQDFLRRFEDVNWRYSNISLWNSVVTAVPRFALETLAFGGIVVIAIYLIQTRQDFGEAIAVMSLYAFAAYRLMPALQQVFRGMSEIRFYLPAVESLHVSHERGKRRALADRSPSAEPLPFDFQIELDRVGYVYAERGTPVLKGLSLKIAKNTSVGFVGATGSGKTTLLDILLGLLEPGEGRILVDGRALTPEDIPRWRQKLGYVPQTIYLCDDSIARNIALGLRDSEIDRGAVERAARIANLHDFIVGLPEGYDTQIGDHGVRLSGGQRQRIGIARALYRDPDILVMDEATSALDGQTEEGVIQAIQQIATRKTMVIVAHRLTTVRDCDVIHVLENGEVVASGTYKELLTTNLRFRAMAKGHVEEVSAL